MDRRCHHQPAEGALERRRQAQVGVVEDRRQQDQGFEHHDGGERHVEGDDHRRSKAGRQQHFAEMEPHRRGGIEKSIQMVDLVEPPEQGNFMVGPMPQVNQPIQNHQVEDEAAGARPPRWAPIGSQLCGPGRQRQDNHHRHHGIDQPQAGVAADPPFVVGPRRRRQQPFGAKKKQQPERDNCHFVFDHRLRHLLHGGDMGYLSVKRKPPGRGETK